MLLLTVEWSNHYSVADLKPWDTEGTLDKPLGSARVVRNDLDPQIATWRDAWEPTHGPIYNLTHQEGFHKVT